MIRFFLSLLVFAILAYAVGVMLSGDELFNWTLAVGLFGFALAGELLRLYLRRSRTRRAADPRQSSGI